MIAGTIIEAVGAAASLCAVYYYARSTVIKSNDLGLAIGNATSSLP